MEWNLSAIFLENEKFYILIILIDINYILISIVYIVFTVAIHKFFRKKKEWRNKRGNHWHGGFIYSSLGVFEEERIELEGLDRPSIPYRISSSRLLPRNLKGFPSGIDDTRAGEFVNFYRAIETFALSRHSNSCGNLSLNIGGGPCLLSSFFFSSFLNPNIYILSRERQPSKLFITRITLLSSFFNSWRIKFFPLHLFDKR